MHITLNDLLSISKNVLNIDSFKPFVEQHYSHKSPEMQGWLNSVFRKWAINNGPSHTVKNLDESSPQWAKDVFQRGEELVVLDYEELKNIIDPILDYFMYLTNQKEKFISISVPDAMLKEKAWHESMEVKESMLKEDGVAPVYTFPDNWRFVRVFGKDSLNREGEEMGHCVGGYYNSVKEEALIIYSLRDPKNRPHVTMEVVGNDVVQIKGKANKAVLDKYAPYCVKFLAVQGFQQVDLDELKVSKKQVINAYKEEGTYKKGTESVIESQHLIARNIKAQVPDFSRDGKILAEIEAKESGVPVGTVTHQSTYIHLRAEDSPSKLGVYNIPESTPAEIIELYLQCLKSLGIESKFPTRRTKNLDTAALNKAVQLSTLEGAGKFKFAWNTEIPWGFTLERNLHNNVFMITSTKQGWKLLAAIKVLSRKLEITVINLVPGMAETLTEWAGKKTVEVLGVTTASRNLQKQLYALAPKKATDPVEKLPGTMYWANTTPEIKKSIKAFNAYIDKDLDNPQLKSKSFTEFKQKANILGIPLSGLIYHTFDAFWIMALQKNKKIILEALQKNKSMVKCLLAFTVMPSSIKAGAFYWHEDEKGRIKLDKALNALSKVMPRIVPLSEKEINSLDLNPTTRKRLLKYYGD